MDFKSTLGTPGSVPQLRLLVLCTSIVVSIAAAEHARADKPWARHTIDNTSRGADGVRLADANGDGRLDVTTGWEEGGLIRVYLQPPAERVKQPWPAVTVGRVKSPEDAVFADLDGDGQLDVVSSCEGRTRSLFAHWAPSDEKDYLVESKWNTAAFPVVQGKQAWMFCVPLDVDGKNGIDLIVGSKGGGASIGWLQSPADPRDLSAWKYHSLRRAGWIMSLVAHDMDGDGDLDVLASDRKGSRRGIVWLENPGPKSKAIEQPWTEHQVDSGDREVMFLDPERLSVHGSKQPRATRAKSATSLEIVSAVRRSPISWLRQTPSSDTWSLTEIPIPAGYGGGKGVAVGDMDLDGQPDVVFTCEGADGTKSGVGWLSRTDQKQSNGKQEPTEAAKWVGRDISGPRGIKFDRIELLDLDADGDLDVMTCEERHNLGVIWYENPTR